MAIDAPVLYAPERRVEREIARRFGRYKASAHSAHHAVAQGRTAGIDLGVALAARGFTLDPAALLGEPRAERIAVEVYPHTIHVLLFGLAERLPYKPKRGRDVAFRRNAMREYQRHLRTLMEREARGALASPDVRRALDPRTATTARGRALKCSTTRSTGSPARWRRGWHGATRARGRPLATSTAPSSRRANGPRCRRRYMRSGALMPISASTRPSAILAASTSRSRAAVSASSSVITLRAGSPCWRKASLKAWKAAASSMP